jgi:undecaprenyl diphosphate synthase
MQGHWNGGQTLVDFIQWCMQDGVQVLTVYAFSSENWNRDPVEVATLMNVLIKYAQSLKTEAIARNIKVNILSTGEK